MSYWILQFSLPIYSSAWKRKKMDSNFFVLSKLVPDFSTLLTQGINSSGGISALFCAILIFIFTFFLLGYVFPSSLKSYFKIRFYLKLLDEATKENLAPRRREIEQNALKSDGHGLLWKEFDETLVYSEDGTRLSNTLDASHFFNTHTLARGITESRLLAAVPGFLTAVGVVGTFLGLQLGIGGLDLDTNDNEVLKHGIASVVSGASIAFMTSVWGVSLSVLFNFIEKAIESKIRKAIFLLQDRIDYLFPRINAEQSLVEISYSSRSSEETLQGLAEKIGNKMQEAVLHVSESVQSGMENSLERIMRPAIEKLVEASSDLASRQAQGSQQILTGLLEKFMDGFGQEGKNQQELMAGTSKEVKDAMSSWTSDMGAFLEKLEKQFSDIEEENKKKNKLLEDQLQQQAETQKTNSEYLNSQLQGLISSMVKDLEKKHEGMAGADNKRHEMFEDQLSQLSQNQRAMMESVNDSVSKHVNASESVVKQGHALTESISDIQTTLQHVSEKVERAGQELNKAAGTLSQATSAVSDTNATLAGAVLDATRSNASAATQNKGVATLFEESIKKLDDMKKDHANTTELLTHAAEKAEKIFESLVTHQKSYQDSLTRHVEDLEEQVNSLLINYSKQVEGQLHDRMVAWDKETQSYTNSMLGVVNVMQDLVDDIDSKHSKL